MTDRVEDVTPYSTAGDERILRRLAALEKKFDFLGRKIDACNGIFETYYAAFKDVTANQAALDAKLDRMAELVLASVSEWNVPPHGITWRGDITPFGREHSWLDYVKHGPRKDVDGG